MVPPTIDLSSLNDELLRKEPEKNKESKRNTKEYIIDRIIAREFANDTRHGGAWCRKWVEYIFTTVRISSGWLYTIYENTRHK